MTSDIVISIEGLWKSYGLETLRRLWCLAKANWRGALAKDHKRRWALRDINLQVHRGETLGIIGRNGAGKSTLLKTLAGVTPLTRGRVEVRGRLFPMIELNAGLHPELTGRENVYLLGAIMGLSRREVGAKITEIEEFCELGEFFEQPVRTYSSGMLARLGFSVAMNVEAEILLIDEVLAVGDLAFQGKCYERMEHIRASEVTILFVSHNIRQIERLCDRTLLIEQGEIVSLGAPADVARQYYEMSQQQILAHASGQDIPLPYIGTGEIIVTGVKTFNAAGQETEKINVFEPMTIRVEYVAQREIRAPIITIAVHTIDMIQILNFSTFAPDRVTFLGSGHFDCTIPRLALAPGVYGIKCGIGLPDDRLCFKASNLAHFRVRTDDFGIIRENAGLVLTDVVWRLDEVDNG